MESILEQTRRLHEELERLEQAAVHQLLYNTRSHKDQVVLETRVASFLDEISQTSKELLVIYTDEDGTFKTDVQAMTGDDAFTEFYSRLKNIKDYYRKLPNELAPPFDPKQCLPDPEREMQLLDAKFTGEESYGKFLDMNSLFLEYSNLKGVKRLNYLNYLDRFARFQDIKIETKKLPEYQSYLVNMTTYFADWIRRAKPLFNIEVFETQIRLDFDELWLKGEVPNWEREQAPMLDPSLYCIPCDKQFTNRAVFESHKTGKKHKKLSQIKGDQANTEEAIKASKEQEYEKHRPLAYAEYIVSQYMEQLSEIRDDTKAHVERKQALTEKERMVDEEEPTVIVEESDEEDDEKIYNPLKLPLGWDGKPIPFWLFKLHGLGVEYPCEICGGYIYMGRKAFDRHFQEWRHAHGMRCLGIPNGRYFQDITKIEDAYMLAEKLKNTSKAEAITADVIEEYEDDEGNVFNKKTYEDLKRQGII
ncbi:hypothetical protein BC833DRAFT_606006 [Globomyces pollinis-pini]|nr:hypothetical protein BC833DRAFT_606006 [Globomyces pollinis-pini]KAJ2992422.1 hypothetical protein HDV02_003074 [Globomyces sp. JEL0801]